MDSTGEHKRHTRSKYDRYAGLGGCVAAGVVRGPRVRDGRSRAARSDSGRGQARTGPRPANAARTTGERRNAGFTGAGPTGSRHAVRDTLGTEHLSGEGQ
ncbi:hypothetical protein GCM10010421_02850 [Streptomyces glaucus]|uniref:Secreted protein n=1 Tax=Streptomyces glaucus TaxID=284029 RepID=A0ABN3J301_9ACTN